jgi:hypothetical protein
MTDGASAEFEPFESGHIPSDPLHGSCPSDQKRGSTGAVTSREAERRNAMASHQMHGSAMATRCKTARFSAAPAVPARGWM